MHLLSGLALALLAIEALHLESRNFTQALHSHLIYELFAEILELLLDESLLFFVQGYLRLRELAEHLRLNTTSVLDNFVVLFLTTY